MWPHFPPGEKRSLSISSCLGLLETPSCFLLEFCWIPILYWWAASEIAQCLWVPTVTLAPGNLIPSSELCGYCMHVHKPTHIHTCIHIILKKKINIFKELYIDNILFVVLFCFFLLFKARTVKKLFMLLPLIIMKKNRNDRPHLNCCLMSVFFFCCFKLGFILIFSSLTITYLGVICLYLPFFVSCLLSI